MAAGVVFHALVFVGTAVTTGVTVDQTNQAADEGMATQDEHSEQKVEQDKQNGYCDLSAKQPVLSSK